MQRCSMEFIYESKGIKINVEYSLKDFIATYDSPFGQMEYGLHIMYICPKTYSEKMLREDYCDLIVEKFIEIEKFLTENSNYIEEKKRELSEKLEGLNEKKELLMQIRRETKKKFKAGQIPVTEHQKACKDVENIKSEIRETKSNFIQEMEDETGVELRCWKFFFVESA